MASLDKLSGETVKELEGKATEFQSFEGFEAEVRQWAGNVWNGEPCSLSDGTYEEFKMLGTQYDSVVDFQNEAARYAELAWGHARQNADPGPQANAHLTGTAAGGDVPPGHAGTPLWVGPGEHGEIVMTGNLDTPQNDQSPAPADEEPAKSFD